MLSNESIAWAASSLCKCKALIIISNDRRFFEMLARMREYTEYIHWSLKDLVDVVQLRHDIEGSLLKVS